MTQPLPHRGRHWPALACGLGFAAVAAGFNIRAALARSPEPLDQALYTALALLLVAGMSLALPALVDALGRRKWGVAAISAAAFILFGSLSLSAALGAAGGHRLDAATKAADHAGRRARALAEYQRLEAELAASPAARSAAELSPVLAVKVASLKGADCNQMGA